MLIEDPISIQDAVYQIEDGYGRYQSRPFSIVIMPTGDHIWTQGEGMHMRMVMVDISSEKSN